MGERLKTLAWMDDATRAEAQKKLATFDPRVGYPVKWRDYSAYAVEPGKLFENVRNGRKFEWNREVARLDEPVDRDEWGMNPQTVNAYYNPLVNQITFPAAILQPPFFDPYADPAVNYGAIGAVIGHEMGHGYDDQGREFDETGKIRNWWTPETNDRFNAATAKFAAQYNAFCPLEGACVNGNFTMGENIGDLGGLEMAYTAYKLSLGGQEAPVIDGFTGDQRFFMAHAQVWRAIQRDDALRAQMLSDPHAPAAARGSIPERNMDAWYAAFDVKEGDTAVPRARRARANLVAATKARAASAARVVSSNNLSLGAYREPVAHLCTGRRIGGESPRGFLLGRRCNLAGQSNDVVARLDRDVARRELCVAVDTVRDRCVERRAKRVSLAGRLRARGRCAADDEIVAHAADAVDAPHDLLGTPLLGLARHRPAQRGDAVANVGSRARDVELLRKRRLYTDADLGIADSAYAAGYSGGRFRGPADASRTHAASGFRHAARCAPGAFDVDADLRIHRACRERQARRTDRHE